MTDLASIPPQHHIALATPRLRLRAVRAGDLAAMHAMRVDAAVMRYMPGVETELVAERSRSVERIRMMTRPGLLSFAVVLPLPAPSPASHGKDEEGEGEIIGFVGTTSPPQIFYIFSRGSWGMGYATEALRAFLGEYWGRFPGGLETAASSGSMEETETEEMEKGARRGFLEAHVHDGNVGSEKVLRNCGFEVVREGKTMAHGVEIGTQVYRLSRPR